VKGQGGSDVLLGGSGSDVEGIEPGENPGDVVIGAESEINEEYSLYEGWEALVT